ncbi:MAG: DUF177 domain-containing protein [Pseudomonadota bacterium]
MLVKIKEIGDNGLSLKLPVTAVWLAAECPGLDAKPGPGGLNVRGQLLETEGQIFLRGKLQGTLESTCSRCLESARLPIDVPLAVTFLPRDEDSDRHKGDDDAAEDDEEENLDVASYDGDEIDLSPEIRDQLLLSLPITPICREDCAGLCPVCGGNRNQVPCTCRVAESPARTPLADVLGKIKI